MCTEKHVLVIKKTLTNKVKPKSSVDDVEHTDAVKKKIRAQRSVKIVILTIFWDMKETLAIDILELAATIRTFTANFWGKILIIY